MFWLDSRQLIKSKVAPVTTQSARAIRPSMADLSDRRVFFSLALVYMRI